MSLPRFIAKDETMEWFITHCHRRRYPAKSTIIYQGDKSDSLYFILEGSVSVVIEDNDGRELVLAYLNAGDFFGEMGLFDGQDIRSAWVKAKAESEIAEIGYSKFQQLVEQNPKILMKLSGQMALRLRNTSRKVGDLAFMDVTGRVARALLDLCKEPDAMTHPDGMQIKITRQELGHIINYSQKIINQILKILKKQTYS